MLIESDVIAHSHTVQLENIVVSPSYSVINFFPNGEQISYKLFLQAVIQKNPKILMQTFIIGQ